MTTKGEEYLDKLEKGRIDFSKGFSGDTLKIFVSYSHEQNVLAGKIKKCFEKYGFEVFLAHEDITASQKWRDSLIENLKTCAIFMPILTKNFKESDWTDQESGIAYYLDKVIIPLRIKKSLPYGFLEKYQGHPFDEEKLGESCFDVSKVIVNHSIHKKTFVDILIDIFVKSSSYKQSIEMERLLVEVNEFTDPQLKKILNGVKTNPQINQAFSSDRFVQQLINKYEDKSKLDLSEWGDKKPDVFPPVNRKSIDKKTLQKPSPFKHFIRQKTRILRPFEYEQLLKGAEKGKKGSDNKTKLNTLLFTGLRYIEAVRFQKNPEWYKPDENSILLPSIDVGKRRSQSGRRIRLPLNSNDTIEGFFQAKPLPGTWGGWTKNLHRWADKGGINPKGLSVKTTRRTWESWLIVSFRYRFQDVINSQGMRYEAREDSNVFKDYLSLPFTEQDLIDMLTYVEGW